MNKYILNRPKEILYLTASGSPRPARLAYRQHGNKLYVIFSKQPPYPISSSATITIGRRIYSVQALPVEDMAEAQRVRYLFDRSASAFSERATDNCQIVRFDIHSERRAASAIIARQLWLLPMLVLTRVVLNAALEWALKRQ